MLNLNPLGMIIGIVYLGLVGSILWWIVIAAPKRHQSEAKRRPKQNCIVVSLTGSQESWEALDLACRVATERRAGLVLAHVIAIPMTLGLNVPLEAAEEKGRLILQEGERLSRPFHLTVECRLIRHRSIVQAVCELAEEIGAETIVVEPGARAWWSFARVERNFELLRHAPCQVLIARAPVAA